MQILIFEGIATSGKSTVINNLVKSLPHSLNIKVFTEQFTHIPIKDKMHELCKDFFTRLISEIIGSDYDVVFFDRLYLTQAFRANSSLDKYLDIETLLLLNPVTTIFLHIDEDEIGNRIAAGVQHRDSSWGKYVNTKGQSLAEQAAYYANQQSSLLGLLSQSKLPYEIHDTTEQDYKGIVNDLKKNILLSCKAKPYGLSVIDLEKPPSSYYPS